ncbi:MAG: 12-oxophytodienoate reductase [Sphingomonadaceae bacterium]
MTAVSPLLEPVTLGRLHLRNRIVMAPMTRELCPQGIPGDDVAAYYARRAKGGTGLIITEGAAPDETGCFGSNVPRLFGREALAGWEKTVRSVHRHGAKIFAQIWHVGAFSPSLIGMQDSLPESLTRLSPSGLAAPDMLFGKAMDEAELSRTIRAFADAAANARETGFDGVEIHGAHGYLPDQFLWSETNRREDDYGGGIEARLRFPAELVQAIRDRTGQDFTISFRLSQWKQLQYSARLAENPAMLADIVLPLKQAGVDMFHCSTRRFWEGEFAPDPRNLAGWVKDITGLPAITVGSVTLDTDFKAPTGKQAAAPAADHIARLEAGVRAGEYDLVAIGRALLANPDWVAKLAAGRMEDMVPFDRSMLEQLH